MLQETTFANLEPLDQKLPPHLPQPVEDLRWEETTPRLWPLKKKAERVVGRTLRLPHMFVEMSPAVLGPPAADILANLEPSAGGNHFLSSPKRYLWDQTPVGDLGQAGLTFWTMNVQRWHPNSKMVQAGKTLEKLSGPCCACWIRMAAIGVWATMPPNAPRPSAPTPRCVRPRGQTSRPIRAPTR